MNIDLSNKQIALLLDLIEHRYFLVSQRLDNEKDPKELNELQELSDLIIVHRKG